MKALQQPHDQPAALSLSATISHYFIGGMMAESADPVQQPLTIFEVRPHRGGWQCFEAPGVAPYWVGKDAKQSAVDYAKARAKYGHGEVRVLDGNGAIQQVIAFHQRGANE